MNYDTSGKHYNSLLYIPEAIWTIQQLTDTLAFKDHWPHDLHDIAEKLFD